MNVLGPSAIRAAGKNEAPPDPKAVKVARDFEAIMLRQMLSCLEKTTGAGSKGPMTGGGGIQTSMMVNVLADALAAAGGIGLGEVLLRSQQPKAEAGPRATTEPSKEIPQGTETRSVHGVDTHA